MPVPASFTQPAAWINLNCQSEPYDEAEHQSGCLLSIMIFAYIMIYQRITETPWEYFDFASNYLFIYD